jgi:ATP-binding cassette subfamily B multidrug efflux pump
VRPLIRLLQYLHGTWKLTVGAYACLIFNSIFTLMVPVLIGKAVDEGIAQADMANVARLSGMIVLVSALRGLSAFGQGVLAEASAQGVSYALRKALYAHVQKLSFSFHDQAQTGELMARATADVEAVRNFTGRGLINICQLILLLIGVCGALLTMNWQLALLSMAVLPALAWRTERFSRVIRPMHRAVQNELANLATFIQENISGIRVVKGFGREQHEMARFDQQNGILFDRYVAATREMSLNGPSLDLLSNVSTLALLWFGGLLLINGQLTYGELVAFYAYLLQLVLPIRRGGWLVAMGSRAAASSERIFEILDTPVSVQDKPGAPPLPQISGRIEFQDVSCSYYPERPVLEHANLVIEPGQTLALVGGTGSGKTTIANLIPRFYDTSEGRVLIDGIDVRDVQIQSLRRQIGVVQQETRLFAVSIRENIAFGVPDATDADIQAAARAARADEFIEQLPDGYETMLEERGAGLSGGQKQRLAIARALLMDPRILILDEFTSSVDLETERLIREALVELMRNRTTVVIAHRVATVRRADQILVLRSGQIVARGTHHELLDSSPEYCEIYAEQIAQNEANSAAIGVEQATADALDRAVSAGGGA